MQEYKYHQHLSLLGYTPDAAAAINGSSNYPSLKGKVLFYQTPMGVIVAAEITGLPAAKSKCQCSVFGFHIHSGTSCTGNENDPFADTLAHYDTGNCLHPCHAGDLPPLFGNDGYAFAMFLTNRFSVSEIIGRTAVIHASPDDMHTQPSGNSGMKIACGVIRRQIL